MWIQAPSAAMNWVAALNATQAAEKLPQPLLNQRHRSAHLSECLVTHGFGFKRKRALLRDASRTPRQSAFAFALPRIPQTAYPNDLPPLDAPMTFQICRFAWGSSCGFMEQQSSALRGKCVERVALRAELVIVRRGRNALDMRVPQWHQRDITATSPCHRRHHRAALVSMRWMKTLAMRRVTRRRARAPRHSLTPSDAASACSL